MTAESYRTPESGVNRACPGADDPTKGEVQAMERAEAFRALRLDPSADGSMVTNAYWGLVRKAQGRVSREPEARAEIERLNEAYQLLAPDARKRAEVPAEPAPIGSGIPPLDWFADWVTLEAQRTRVRWQGRNPEVAILGGASIVLMLLALGAGASIAATFIVIAIILAAVWAPWRRVE
jgi:hypothetical protein